MKVSRRFSHRSFGRGLPALALALALVAGSFVPVEAQYFGRNKVQYDDFDFRVLTTDHFDIHYYPEEGRAIEDVARMSERWYERLARTFQHEFEARKPLIIYADHPDFQQTNTLQGSLGEGTGGVTESLKNRVIMPLTGSYWDTDHVLGHELVHAFQYNIAQSRRGGGLQGLNTLPLWLVEGMAEYLSVGRDDPLTAMWLRDAVRRDDFPTIKDLNGTKYFPYRFGQALWAYIGGEYGDAAVIEIYRRSLRSGFQPALQQVLGADADTVSIEWRRRVEQAYIPLMANRSDPDSVGKVILSEDTGAGTANISPSLSPDGRYIAYISDNDLFSYDIFIADAQTGKVVRKLVSADSDPHGDAIRFVEAAGTWSPDGEYFAYPVFAGGDNEIVIVRTRNGDVWKHIKPPGLGAVNNPSWSPDGRYLAFTGFDGGISDLYLWDLQDEALTRLTDDRYADFQPSWSPDGRTIAFASDRGAKTDWSRLAYSPFQIALVDVATRAVRVLPLFDVGRHQNPQYSPDGRGLYFIADQDGFADIYRLNLDTNEVRRLTHIATGVSGITSESPALSVARISGDIAFSVFNEFNYQIHTLPSEELGELVATTTTTPTEVRGRRLPPTDPEEFSRVADYLGDPTTGLPEAGTYQTADSKQYKSGLALDYIGQPTIGVAADRFGGYVGGGASAFFSDMLGNKFLGVAIQAQGTIKDIGGQVVYQDIGNRWNWAVGASHIPYLLLSQNYFYDPASGGTQLSLLWQRILVTSATGQVAYPLSATRRIEFGTGLVRYGVDLEEERYIYDQYGRPLTADRIDRSDIEPAPTTLAEVSTAYVEDNSFFGFTSPIRGKRLRFELVETVGDEHFITGIADFRRYFQPNRNLTVAFRGLHYGRYGSIDTETQLNSTQRFNPIQPLFLGFESLIRGYAIESFENEECIRSAEEAGTDSSTCPAFTRLQGNRLGVMNLELRIPLLGVEQYGLINFPYLPTELVLFQDAGVAWDKGDPPLWKFSRSSSQRVPVFSTGVGARFNILGIFIVEAYYAKPWQRPYKGAHWGFQLQPGW